MSAAGTPLRFADGRVKVLAKPSEVPPDQLEALRRHKDALAPIVEAFGEVEVSIRPTPEPPDLVRERMRRIRARMRTRRQNKPSCQPR